MNERDWWEREKKRKESLEVANMAVKEVFDARTNPKIIAMKGHPCTGKTSVARVMATEIECSLISLDDILNSFQQLPLQATNQSIPTQYLVDRSFEALCRITSNQLIFGMKRLILDSPLTCRAHLDSLLRISASTGVPLVVVECRPTDRYQWKLWVDNESKWDEIAQLLLHDSDYDAGLVSKIVIDTTREYDMDMLISKVDLFASFALDYQAINCFDFHDLCVALENDLLSVDNGVIKVNEAPVDSTEPGLDETLCNHKHLQVSSPSRGGIAEETCAGCQTTITPDSSAYFCPKCRFSLHKVCAELPDKKELRPQDYPVFLREVPNDHYIFLEEVKCVECQSDQTKEIKDCRFCILASYLRSAELPAVLQHPCHEHLLQVNAFPIYLDSMFRCRACGDTGKHIRYTCYKCRFDYHLTCCLLPHVGKESHHRHNLTITSSDQCYDPDEEFICNACEKYRNPKNWFYHCYYGCQFECHLECMTFDVQD